MEGRGGRGRGREKEDANIVPREATETQDGNYFKNVIFITGDASYLKTMSNKIAEQPYVQRPQAAMISRA